MVATSIELDEGGAQARHTGEINVAAEPDHHDPAGLVEGGVDTEDGEDPTRGPPRCLRGPRWPGLRFGGWAAGGRRTGGPGGR